MENRKPTKDFNGNTKERNKPLLFFIYPNLPLLYVLGKGT